MVTAGYPALCPVIPVPQIALKVKIVLNGLQGKKGLTDCRVQDTAVHSVLQGTGYYRVHCNSGYRVLQGKEYCSVQKTRWYCRV